jgi:hypothetical protein
MVKFAIVITLGLVAGQACAQDCPRASEAEDVKFCDLTPNERVQQAFEALKPPETLAEFNGPFMRAYGATAPFVCTAVGPDGWCMNPFGAMAKE